MMMNNDSQSIASKRAKSRTTTNKRPGDAPLVVDVSETNNAKQKVVPDAGGLASPGAAPCLQKGSRVAALVAEYERWYAFYCYADGRSKVDDDPAGKAAEFALDERSRAMVELRRTPARDLFELALKGRVLRAEANYDWWGGASYDLHELSAMNIIDELLSLGGVAPMLIDVVTPQDLIKDYIDPPMSSVEGEASVVGAADSSVPCEFDAEQHTKAQQAA